MVPSKVYFLVPGWDFSSDSIPLGSIITNPAQPHIALFRPRPEDVDTLVNTTRKDGVTSSIDLAGTGSAGLFWTFLSSFGLGDEVAFQYDRQNVLSYSFIHLRSHSFDPSDRLVLNGVDRNRVVAQFLRSGEFATPVYMVTAIKTIKGAGVTVASRKGKGWRVTLGVSHGDESQTHDSHHDAGAEEASPIVFAFQLRELNVSSEGGVVSSDFGAKEGSEGLQGKLDNEFGQNMFTVLQGFDEEDGSPCQIIASSPICVDLLTASSARINASWWHGNR